MEKTKEFLWNKIDEQSEDLISLCSDLIKINSENPPGNMEPITEYICNYLEKKEIPYEVVRPEPNKPNIIARLGNKNGKTLLFNGHSDVVPVGDRSKWSFDPFSGEVVDGKLLGRGTSDMKAGLGGVLFAMGVLREEEVEINGEIVFTVVPDEEISGEMGTKWLVENGYAKGDYCIVAEPTYIGNIEVGQRGTLWTKVTATGISAHGSLWPYAGDNAIVKLVKLLSRIDEVTKLKGEYDEETQEVINWSKDVAKNKLQKPNIENIIDHVSVNIGKISGGIKTNMVADHAEVELDIRIPLGVTTHMVIAELERIAKELGIEGLSYDFMWRSEPNNVSIRSPIVQSVKANAEAVIGRDVTTTYQWASSDARYYRMAGIDTIQYGPANTEGIHSYDETVDVADIIDATKVYVGAVIDLL